ncbi:conserved membrane hypothetical protein [Candidatus Roizmanbacteria bacterium]|nr:conserved membrane hypothetical protein [Candidatus Roizmanbacteria bacterium]
MYLYEKVSPFGFFRSFSRFIILYLVIFIFLFTFLFKNWKNKYKNYFLLLTILLLIISNTIFFSGDLGGFIASAKLPKEYISVNEKYFQKDQSQYNILTLPNIPYESYIWFFADKKTRSGEYINQSTYFRELFFSKPVVYNRYAVNLDFRNDLFKSFFKYGKEFKFPGNFSQIIDGLNVKYILVQKDLINVLENNIPVPVKKYINYFNKDSGFILKENNKSFALYENKGYLPIVLMSDMQFIKVNDTKYILFIKNLKDKESLSFLQGYNEQWKLYLQSNSDDKKCKSIKYYENVQTTECKSVEQKIDREELSYLYKNTIFDDTHKLVNQYANGWTINPDYIKQNFSKKLYKENPDGSIDIKLTLYFQSQSYFYLGIIITSIMIFSCFAYLGIRVVKNKNISLI